MTPGQEILKKKIVTVVVGWILLVIGLIGLILALMIYPIWQDNRDLLAEKEFYGVDTPEDHSLVETQTVLVTGGLLVGIPLLLGGAYLVASAWSFNRKVEGVLIQKALQPSGWPQPAVGSPTFCPNCGNRLVLATPHCPMCGRKL